MFTEHLLRASHCSSGWRQIHDRTDGDLTFLEPQPAGREGVRLEISILLDILGDN